MVAVLFTASAWAGNALRPVDKPGCKSPKQEQFVSHGGIYPHLAMFNDEGECGTGAVVSWAGDLWVITYGPHLPVGSSDKLYRIRPDLTRETFPGSVGGTPANRLIHRETNQLLIGPYVIDAKGNVRVVPPSKMPGRLTGAARHIEDPANKVYVATMETGLYELDMRTLAVNTLIRENGMNDKTIGAHLKRLGLPWPDGWDSAPRTRVPGYHSKGLASGFGRVFISNNGENSKEARRNPFVPSGVLAWWNEPGRDWTTIRRCQFTEVTTPDGIYGNEHPDANPVWAMGWDAKSVILGVTTNGTEWTYYRLPKASHCYDGAHGWNTEWPRIRDVGFDDGALLATMHGTFWRFPRGFSPANPNGIRPISTYLKVIGDFCRWGDRIVFGCDDQTKNEFLGKRGLKKGAPRVKRSQSNLWFVKPDELSKFGPPSGEGSVWLNENVKAGDVSDPFLYAGYESMRFSFRRGDGSEVRHELLRDGDWVRVKCLEDAKGATARFSYGPAPCDTPALDKDRPFITVQDDHGKKWRFPNVNGDTNVVCREIATERDLFYAGGVWYEVPAENAGGFAALRPVALADAPVKSLRGERGLMYLNEKPMPIDGLWANGTAPAAYWLWEKCRSAGAGGVQRERLSDGWEFMRADGSASETNSAAWRAVRVPHDWGVEKSFDPAKPYGDAYLEPTGVGWYRRTFRLDPARVAAIKSGGFLFFESNGMMSHSKVWVNGKYVGGWPYGYTAFRCDLTPHLNPDGENTLVVRCHNHVDSSRWYTGGGMYRECRFAFCPADYLIPGSVAITTPEVTKGRATVHVEWEMSQSGKKERTFTVESPRFWDIDDPYLYKLEIEGETFRYGIRTIAFYPDARGFQLNGRRVELKGVCIHHDLGVLGAAYNRAAMKRRFLKLKEAGVNAIRCSHNPEDPDFLDLCDELGLLVKDEVFDEWRRTGASGKRKDGYSKLFDEWHERDVRAWVRADRNHPSVIMWSLGNEIPEGHPRIAPTSEFIRIAKTLDAVVKSEDLTRPTTNANNERANATNEYGRTLDIYGFNYSCYMFGPFKRKNPDKPFFGSETQCALASRGAYTFPVKWGWTQQKTGSLHVSGYGVEACGWSGDPGKGWACAPDAQWFNMDAHPECMGEFVWTGWDYLGGPYWADAMVKKFKIKGIHSCATGFIDLAGFPKDTFWLFQSRWRPDFPMVHIVPHWNWPDRVGKVTPVHVFTSGDEGELFLNGRSLGRQKKDPKNWKKAYRLTWDDVVYEPGTLKVVTYKKGVPWAEKTIATTGPAAQLKLEVEGGLDEDSDLAFVNLEVQDAEGRFVPDAAVDVTFSVRGPCELVATDNGDEADFTSFHSPTRRTFSGRLQAIVRKKPNSTGTIAVTASSSGLQDAVCQVANYERKRR